MHMLLLTLLLLLRLTQAYTIHIISWFVCLQCLMSISVHRLICSFILWAAVLDLVWGRLHHVSSHLSKSEWPITTHLLVYISILILWRHILSARPLRRAQVKHKPFCSNWLSVQNVFLTLGAWLKLSNKSYGFKITLGVTVPHLFNCLRLILIISIKWFYQPIMKPCDKQDYYFYLWHFIEINCDSV